MSARDYAENHKYFDSLVGRRCFLSLAANTAKIHIDENRKGGDYIWVDAPWRLLFRGEVVSSSACYPDDESCRTLFERWSAEFEPVREGSIRSIAGTENGALTIRLENDFAWEVPADSYQSDDDDDWYDHWYIKLKNQSGEQVVPPKSDRAGG